MRNRNTIEFIGIWEQLNNPDFNTVEFDGFRKEAGLNIFILTPKQWIANSQQTVGQISSQTLLQLEKSFGRQAVAHDICPMDAQNCHQILWNMGRNL